MNEIIYNKKCSFPGSIPLTKQENIFQIMIENYPSWKERLEKNRILSLDNKHDESTDTSIKTDDFISLKSCIVPIDESSYDFKKNVEKLYLTKR